jgi:hypothetical protein
MMMIRMCCGLRYCERTIESKATTNLLAVACLALRGCTRRCICKQKLLQARPRHQGVLVEYSVWRLFVPSLRLKKDDEEQREVVMLGLHLNASQIWYSTLPVLRCSERLLSASHGIVFSRWEFGRGCSRCP